ncbi:MAG TPA: hypothetical protein VHP32_08745 [Ignavibacteria bacterium]|nr:hypothetical protein [Ignavibacteria bacterium]
MAQEINVNVDNPIIAQEVVTIEARVLALRDICCEILAKIDSKNIEEVYERFDKASESYYNQIVSRIKENIKE